MRLEPKVFVLVLSGQEKDALTFAKRHYPACESVLLSKIDLRESGWKNQLRKLRQLKGQALVIFADSLKSLREPMLLKWTVFLHGCRETVVADSSGAFEVNTKLGSLLLLPRTFLAALVDLALLACTWAGLQMFRIWLKRGRRPQMRHGLFDIAMLCPSQAGLDSPGGAQTHVTGFLSGLMQEEARVGVFSGRPLPIPCDLYPITGLFDFHLFREAAALSYNVKFVLSARRLLEQKGARLLYQRHGRFIFAGALLSRLLRIPLVLEYNASEEWMAKHWDPTRFSRWLRLCERVSVESASLIVVVSHPLKQQLLEQGVSPERILVNPNAVDPEFFHPNCGGARFRKYLGFEPEDRVICFVGTFSYWHGVAVLEQAIQSVLEAAGPVTSVKFLLIGDGPLAAKMRNALEGYVRQGSVTFTGTIPHASVREYLDAADILVSPHIPLPDGNAFFGSPTKLFEYMAMGKAIVASALDQIADVLEDGRTALLVRPGDPGELVEGIQRLVADAQLRLELGCNAREAVLTRHTWRHNAKRVLRYCEEDQSGPTEAGLQNVFTAGDSPSPSTNLAKQNP
jgi:glycosyltransferase involved in cell wall biosynthesis